MTDTPQTKVVVTTYVSYHLANRIDKIAKLKRCKRSAAVADILEEYFSNVDSKKQTRPCQEPA